MIFLHVVNGILITSAGYIDNNLGDISDTLLFVVWHSVFQDSCWLACLCLPPART
ncbi:hypothetical protein LZ32DRAFT_607546 [Colletotrichum eremochloae]|nr:hypothetical protein LZ32DRAFT_607546 [Colletotrichum eremochloae]